MFCIHDPGEMTTEERFQELAQIFAHAFLRLHKKERTNAHSAKSPQLTQKKLDCSSQQSVHRQAG